MLSKGVTPENNAVVLIWQAFGPGDLAPEQTAEYFKLLGIPAPPISGRYFTPIYGAKPMPIPRTGDQDPNDPETQLMQAQERPWSKIEFPAVAKWLQANRVPLQLAIEASHRPRYFSPLMGRLSGDKIPFALPLFLDVREFAYLLETDATLKVGEGKLADAWQEALACHRLGRLVSQGPTLTDMQVGRAIDGIAIHIDGAIAGSDRLSAEQARQFAREFAELPPLKSVAENLDLGERVWVLENVLGLGTATVSGVGIANYGIATAYGPPRWTPNWRLDWDATLRRTNAWYDRLVETARIMSPEKRRSSLAALENDLTNEAKEVEGTQIHPLGYCDRTGAKLTEKAISISMIASSLPAIAAEDHNLDLQDMCRVAFALGAYRAEQGRFPTSLNALVPRYIEQVPKNRFSGSELHFKLETNSYVLYGADMAGNDTPLTDPKDDPLNDGKGRFGLRVPTNGPN